MDPFVNGFADELKKIAVAEKLHGLARLKDAFLSAAPEAVPALTGSLGAMAAHYYGKPISAGAALGGSIGAIPYLLRESKGK